jgi:hypothetical protein
MEVSEFLRAVRPIVVDFAVGRVFSHNGDASGVSGLDDITTLLPAPPTRYRDE